MSRPRTPALAIPAGVPIADWLRETSTGLSTLAVAIGAGAGLGAIAFRRLIKGFTRALSGEADYSDVGRIGHPWLPALGPWFLLITPVLAAVARDQRSRRASPLGRWQSRSVMPTAVRRRRQASWPSYPPGSPPRHRSFEALDALSSSQGTGLPVLDPSGQRLLGWISHQSILTVLR